MINLSLSGLPLEQALALLASQGIKPPDVIYTKPPSASFDITGRTPRVLTMQEDGLMVAYFKDGDPKEKDSSWK